MHALWQGSCTAGRGGARGSPTSLGVTWASVGHQIVLSEAPEVGTGEGEGAGLVSGVPTFMLQGQGSEEAPTDVSSRLARMLQLA